MSGGWALILTIALVCGLRVSAEAADEATSLELAPATVDQSPVLQRWSEQTPDVLFDIRHDPSFRTRLRAGYAQFPEARGGGYVGVEDWFLGKMPLTLNLDYQSAFSGGTAAYGATLRYYVLPLGSYVNAAPIIGYRRINAPDYDAAGLDVGFQVKVMPSRGGGADFAYTQTWIDPTGPAMVSTTQLEFGYALTHRLRLSTEIEWQFAPGETDSRVGVGLEWML